MNNEYYLTVVNPTEKDNFNIPYILYIPKNIEEKATLAVEINAKETNDLEEVLEEGLGIVERLEKILHNFNNPILIPLIPKTRNNVNFKHLTKECWDLPSHDLYYRIDNQVLNIINKAKEDIKKITGVNIANKIFMTGYSSSGVFAQRFALLYPKFVDTICVGGAFSSIPFPVKMFAYPLGIGGIKELIGKDFDILSYFKVNFKYYCSEFENKIKASIKEEDGFVPSIYDICYLDKDKDSCSSEKYIFLFGNDVLERGKNVIEHSKGIGMKISAKMVSIENENNILNNNVIQNYIYNAYSEMNIEKEKIAKI